MHYVGGWVLSVGSRCSCRHGCAREPLGAFENMGLATVPALEPNTTEKSHDNNKACRPSLCHLSPHQPPHHQPNHQSPSPPPAALFAPDKRESINDSRRLCHTHSRLHSYGLGEWGGGDGEDGAGSLAGDERPGYCVVSLKENKPPPPTTTITTQSWPM